MPDSLIVEKRENHTTGEEIGGQEIFDQEIFNLRDSGRITPTEAAIIIRLLRFSRPIAHGARFISPMAVLEYLLDNARLIDREIKIGADTKTRHRPGSPSIGNFKNREELESFVLQQSDSISNTRLAKIVNVSYKVIKDLRKKHKKGPYRELED